ncbi:MAG: tetratricopeptide repeat protein [Cyanobacteria bacterium SZAS TMP-1]|nr:tetratricopeptide repeat protein [Cyanobacteria bacterium SZAS TMP-1]
MSKHQVSRFLEDDIPGKKRNGSVVSVPFASIKKKIVSTTASLFCIAAGAAQSESVRAGHARASISSSHTSTEFDTKDNGGLPITKISFWIDRRRGDEARRLIDKVKPTLANTNLIHLWRGLAYRADREPELAVAEFDKCTDFREGKDWYGLIAGSYSQVERWDRAIKILDQAVATVPGHASYYAQRGDYRCAKGDFAGSIPDYKKAATLNSELKRSYLSIAADILRRQGKVKEAIALLDQGMGETERHSDGKFYLCRAQCFDQLGNWEQGEKNCTEALRVGRSAVRKGKTEEELLISRALIERAKCYDNLGKKDQAAQDRALHLKMSSETADEIMGTKR